MSDFWKDDLSEEETEALIQKAALQVTKRRLETPAILALEMHKPLCNVLAQSTIVFAPFLVPFFGFDFLNEYSSLFSKQANVERLICILEESRAAGSMQLEK